MAANTITGAAGLKNETLAFASQSRRDFGMTETGIHTVEGNLAGNRAAGLTKKREAAQKEYADKKRKIQEDHARGVGKIDDKFNSNTREMAAEGNFRKQTVGLVTAAQFRAAHADVLGEPVEEEGKSEAADAAAKVERAKAKKAEQKKKKAAKKQAATLSFFGDDDGAEEGGDGGGSGGGDGDGGGGSAGAAAGVVVAKKPMKNPSVNTDFLPDRAREAAEEQERARLREDWLAEQERIKGEPVEVIYSYWDGSGHRREITVTKGTTIGKFLQQVASSLSADFSELRAVSSDNLIYIKEDLLIPHHYSFYDLIVTKARGKSGPLFHFDVHDDVRITDDVRVEKDESHPGKIVLRAWYERNKHIFPASRWETYDPHVKRDRYTIHGDEVNAKE